MSRHAGHILRSVSQGTVHSIYRRTINLTAGEQLIALQTAESPLSPISLVSSLTPSDMESLPVKKGDAVKFSNGYLDILTKKEEVRFSYLNADTYDLKLSALVSSDASSGSAEKLAENISVALSEADTGGFDVLFKRRGSMDTMDGMDNMDLPLTLLAAGKRIAQSIHLYKNGAYTEAGLELSRLLGLGTGLTPSGDDFLCGVLAGLRLLGLEQEAFNVCLKEEIAKHLSDTIDISAAFLSCALEGQYSLAVNRLSSLPSPEEILAGFSAIGHSSGVDTLCGVLFALELKSYPSVCTVPI